MDQKEIASAIEKMYDGQRRMSAFNHAVGLISYDGATSAPAETANNRASAITVLSGEMYKMALDRENRTLLKALEKEQGKLSPKDRRVVLLQLKSIRETEKIPEKEYIEYSELTVKADDVWHRAKATSDFESFRSYLEKVFEYQKRFATYRAPGMDPYEKCLDGYEEGLTTQILDGFFSDLRDKIVPLVKEISGRPQIDDSIRFGDFPEDKQRDLAYFVMKTMGLDPGHVGLAETEHPFTTYFGSHFDTRITTHYHRDDFVASLYSVARQLPTT